MNQLVTNSELSSIEKAIQWKYRVLTNTEYETMKRDHLLKVTNLLNSTKKKLKIHPKKGLFAQERK